MIVKYPAIYEIDEKNNDYFNVFFPDLIGCLTSGKGLLEARNNAKIALSLQITSENDYKNHLPSKIEDLKNSPYLQIEYVEVEI